MPVYEPPQSAINETVNVTRKPSFWQNLLGAVPLVGPLLQSGTQYLMDSIAAKKQRKIALENWQRENAYNSPAAMLQRYREAGINPAYANNMNLTQANSTISDDAGVVARANVPNAMAMLTDYINLQHSEAQAKTANEQYRQEKLKTVLIEASLWDEIEKRKAENMSKTAQGKLAWMKTKQHEFMFDDGSYPEIMKYQGEAQKYFNAQAQNTGINLDNALKQISLDMGKKGLTPADSAFLRVLSRKQLGEEGANDIFPYVLGDRFASFAGDLVKIGIPSGAISKMWQQTRPQAMRGSKPSKKMQPNNNFYD